MVKGSRAPIAVLCGLLALSAAAILIAWSTGSWTQPAASPSHGGTLTVHIHLDSTHVVAGLNLNGYVLLTNNTRRPLAHEGCPAEWLLVGLQSASIPFNPAIADDCFGKTPLGPLQSRRVAVSVSTTYTSVAEVREGLKARVLRAPSSDRHSCLSVCTPSRWCSSACRRGPLWRRLRP